ncbi:hypothetical protein MBLNU230_g7717t1 [Neophaeotheca triangularis]
MDRLPEEVVLQIITYLNHLDVVRLQGVSSRYLFLGRDNVYWKLEAFDHSRAEALRRRQQLLDRQGSSLAEIRNAISALPGSDLTAFDVAQIRGSSQGRASSDPHSEARDQRNRALANWEPGYPGEQLDYYEEYIQRHAPINVGWLDVPNGETAEREVLREITGVGALHSSYFDTVEHVVAPLDDGSISIWDLAPRTTSAIGGAGKPLHQTAPGFLTGLGPDDTAKSHAIMTETGAVECVSVDSSAKRGYFAVNNMLHEVDLQTMQRVGVKQYPFPITALSEARDKVPITVGTNMTIHLHDPRDDAFTTKGEHSNGELIGGSPHSHATLSQPGPLSILHHAGLDTTGASIWIAGRFTSLLNYDRRLFPRLRGTVHSGARVACLSALPYPHLPRDLDLMRNPSASMLDHQNAKTSSGTTILAAAEYKGKGSLELYGLPHSTSYQNRQTASASKLLSVTPHGGRIVFSDGDGNLKWVERDGFSHVRSYNINEAIGASSENPAAHDTRASGIWSSTNGGTPGHGDIVQKIIPTLSSSQISSSRSERADVAQSNLLLWTGDGRLGVLGFGHRDPLSSAKAVEEWHDAVESQHVMGTAEARSREDAERQYAMRMRRALERNADEVRFVRGLGMGI